MAEDRYHTVVTRQHVRRREFELVAATLVAAVVLGVGFYLGQHAAYSGMGMDPEEYRRLQQENSDNAMLISELERELELGRDRREIDREALELVRQDLARQGAEIADLEEALTFYRSVLAPETLPRGLSLRPVELVATTDPTRVEFRVVAQQQTRKHNTLTGKLEISIKGELNGAQVSYNLSELSEEVDSASIALRFRYFQAIEGTLQLPPGFRPLEMVLIARSTRPVKAEARLQSPWQLQEKFTHVGW